ncbi:MAG: AAA family ATPase [Armatimonadetes bacterium]|nr:AAA family ATPase [Armatimonadota bacterium]
MRLIPFQNPANDQYLADIRRPWLIPGILPDCGLVILASPPKTGKTCFATGMALAVARGTDFLDRPTRQSPVLWCSYEENRWERKLLHDGIADEEPFYIAYREELPPIDDFQDFTDRVVSIAAELNCRLIVIDSLHAAVRRTNLSDNGAARRAMQNLKDINFQVSATILVLHHVTRSASKGASSDRFADSAQILATATTQMLLEPCNDSPRQFKIHAQGRYPVPDSELFIEATGMTEFKLVGKDSLTQNRISKVILKAIAELGTSDAVTLSTHLNQNVGTIRNALTRLANEGQLIQVSRQDRTIKYSLPAPSEDDPNSQFTNENL